MIYVLDASAMIAYLRNEPGAEVVEDALTGPGGQCSAHAINLCEVFYDFLRIAGETEAANALADLSTIGIAERNDFDRDFWLAAGRLKRLYHEARQRHHGETIWVRISTGNRTNVSFCETTMNGIGDFRLGTLMDG